MNSSFEAMKNRIAQPIAIRRPTFTPHPSIFCVWAVNIFIKSFACAPSTSHSSERNETTASEQQRRKKNRAKAFTFFIARIRTNENILQFKCAAVIVARVVSFVSSRNFHLVQRRRNKIRDVIISYTNKCYSICFASIQLTHARAVRRRRRMQK